ncbi:MAG: invasion associated locus B family protein [Alphaproteobacteria bacterium]|nr:invasion associated locus B family protein [Alphaproteobacteria bacterium]
MSLVRSALTVAILLWGMALSPATAPARAAPKSESKAAPAASGPALIGQFDAWGVYSGMRGGKKVCFALAKPSMSRTNPPNRPRDPAYIFVTTTPSGTVVNQVSVIIGYTVKADTTSTIDIGNASYVMYALGDGMWIKNEAEEARMVEAMRRSAELLVRGTSSRGVDVVDSYSLKGLAQALDRIAQDCRR